MSLKLNSFDAPHIRYHETTRTIMIDAVITMLILYGMALYYYGMRTLNLLAAGVLSAVITDCICVLFAGKRLNPRDFSPVVTGMILPLLMPASIDYWILIVACVFAILVAKHPFGGVGHNVFNPAAAGFGFVAICFPERLFTYPIPLERLPAFGEFEAIPGISPAYTLTLGGIPKYDLVEMALGNFPGPMGCTNIVVILTCLLYLVSRNTVRWVTPFCFFASAAAFAYIFPRIGEWGSLTHELRTSSVMYEMMSGMMLFGGIFLLGDPVTTPKRGWSKAAFAVTAGIAAMMFRRFGSFEEEFPFAVLLMNATVWMFDMVGERIASLVRRRKFETIGRDMVQAKPPDA